MLPAIVLAAGESTRMGYPKALLLDPDGRPFVVRIVRSLAAAGLRDIVVVTGSRHDDIATALSEHDGDAVVRLARNPEPSRGQLSSLWIGMDAVAGDRPDGILMTLVDVPMIAPATIRCVADEWRRSRAPIVRPGMGVRRGHPVIFDRSVFEELRRAPLEQGARVVVNAHAAESIAVPVDDPGCIVDVDTPEQYRQLGGSHS